MNKVGLLALTVLTVSQGELLLAQPLDVSIPEIRKYYTDYNYVVAYSTISERKELVRHASETPADGNLPTDSRLGTLYELIKGLLAAEREVDPYIIRGNRLAADFLYAKIPLSIASRTKDHMSIRTLRQEIRALPWDDDKEKQLRTPQGLYPGRNEVLSYIELDYWDMIQGKWKLSSFHVYPLGD